jgi:hypothetical protein
MGRPRRWWWITWSGRGRIEVGAEAARSGFTGICAFPPIRQRSSNGWGTGLPIFRMA